LRNAGHRSTHTTALAERFERSGFSIIRKSACPPPANGVTTEPPGFPSTRDPWDLTQSVGGSSGGAAAAVACGAVPVAHGSDATGSLRFPAALCGLVTLVPTAGTIETVPPCTTNPIERLDAGARPDEGQLAAAAFLARYGGRTLDAYRHDLRVFVQWAADLRLGVQPPPGFSWNCSSGPSRREVWPPPRSTGGYRRYAASTASPTSTDGSPRTRPNMCAAPRSIRARPEAWTVASSGRSCSPPSASTTPMPPWRCSWG